jgi:hypothetical protein
MQLCPECDISLALSIYGAKVRLYHRGIRRGMEGKILTDEIALAEAGWIVRHPLSGFRK